MGLLTEFIERETHHIVITAINTFDQCGTNTLNPVAGKMSMLSKIKTNFDLNRYIWKGNS